MAGNGFKGARWRELRDMVKAMNQVMRDSGTGSNSFIPPKKTEQPLRSNATRWVSLVF